jgi:predicted  nucleic acid-binding Zn-ribbon protein
MNIFRNAILALMGVILLAFSACNNKDAERLRAENEALKKERAEDSLYISDLTTEMDVVYNKLDSMRRMEERIRQTFTDLRDGRVAVAEGGMNIDQTMEAIEAEMQQSKQVIRQLEAKLKEAGKENSALAKVVEELKKTVGDKDAQIGMLQDRIVELEGEVEGWKSKYADKLDEADSLQLDLDVKITEVNTAYYIVGTEKDLKNAGILVNRKRGFSANKSLDKFTKIDIRETTKITLVGDKINLKKVKVIPARPTSTYELTEEGGVAYLNITDYEGFWKSSKTLAVMTKSTFF